jgi:thioredoxin 1
VPVEPANLTSGSFDDAVSSSAELYLVDFWADGCFPCVAYEPIVAGVAGGYGGRVEVGRVDIAAEPDIAERCGVKSVPALVLFRDGQIVKRIFGARGERVLRNELDALLA